VGAILVAKLRVPSLSEQADEWLRKASAAAIAAVRRAIKDDGAIPPKTPAGLLSDNEIGWLVSGALFGWIATRSAQATAEGWDHERTIRTTGLVPNEPWDAGAVIAILPKLFDACPDLDWSKPDRRVAARNDSRVSARSAEAHAQGDDRPRLQRAPAHGR